MLEIPHTGNYEDKDLETLIDLRQELMNEIKDYEDKYILHTKALSRNEQEIIENPSPEVIYISNNQKLELLTQTINVRLEKQIEEKINKFIHEEEQNKKEILPDEQFYYVFVEYEDDAYGREYCYISEDTTIDIGDLVLVDRRGEEVVAEVTMTNYYTYINAPYPVDKTKHVIKLVEKFEDYLEEDEEQVEDNVTEGAALIKTNESKISKIFAKAITFIRKIF